MWLGFGEGLHCGALRACLLRACVKGLVWAPGCMLVRVCACLRQVVLGLVALGLWGGCAVPGCGGEAGHGEAEPTIHQVPLLAVRSLQHAT